MQRQRPLLASMTILTLLLNFIDVPVDSPTHILTGGFASPAAAAGLSESFEDVATAWIVETDASGAGSSVTGSGAQKRTGVSSAAAFTTNSNGKAQVRDVISSNWSSVPTGSPGAFIWQRAYVYIPSATANALTGSEYLDLGGLYVSGDSSGFYLRLRASGALYASAPGTTGQAEFNLYGTFPLDQWVEVELGLWSRNTGDLDRAGCFIINGQFYGWFTNGRSGTNYSRAAMGIVATNSADDLTVYLDDWYIFDTGTNPTGTDLRPTGATYTKNYTTQSGENVGYHYTTWENGYTLQANYGLSPSTRIQSSIETSRMPDLSNGWSQIVIDWAGGQTPPWPPERIGQFFGPMLAFRKSVELEENLEVVPVYRSATRSVDLVFESWTVGPIEYASWQLPMDGSGHRIPGQGDVIRVKWQEVSATQLRVRVDYFDASAGTWNIDVIDHTRALNNVNGVNFLADTHRAVTNTIDSNDYTIRSQTVGILEGVVSPSVARVTRADPNPTGAASVNFNVAFSTEVTGVDHSDFRLATTGVTGAYITGVQGSGANYTVAVNTGSGNGTIHLNVLDDDSIQGSSSIPLGGYGVGNGNFTAGETYDVIKTVLVTGNSGVPGATLGYTDGVPKTAMSQTNGSYSISVAYNWSGTVTPTRPCYTFDPVDRSYTNVVGNQTNQNYIASLVPNTVCILTNLRANASPTDADSVDFTVTFTGDVTGVDAGDFAVYAPGVTGASVTNVSGSGAIYTVTVDTGSGDGILRLDVPNTATITDLSLNALSGLPYTLGDVYTIWKSGRFPGADFNGDGKTDVAVFRPSNSTWYIQGAGSFVYGQANDIPVPADYNGDGKDDVAVFRPSNSTWYIQGVGPRVYGTVGDLPVVADYNGDGKDDVAVFRPGNSTWYIYGVGSFVYGTVGDIPVPADYNGDGKDDIAVFRPTNSTWYIYGVGPRVYGTVGDIPVVADFNGDGKDDIAVFRPTNSTWYIYGVGPRVYGAVGDIAVVGDYNADGKSEVAVFRPSNSTWYIYGVGPSVYGTMGDVPV